MARNVITTMTDDIDGSQATETIAFAIYGTSYEIDLSEQNAQRMRRDLGPFIAHARRLSRPARDGRPRRGRRRGRDHAPAVRVGTAARNHHQRPGPHPPVCSVAV